MKKEKLIKMVIATLEKEYPDAKCTLNYCGPFQLLVAARLSAQCTDARVNKVTPKLFERFSSMQDFGACKYDELEKYIFSCGLYKTKARDIIHACQMLLEYFGGKIPDTIEKLITLPSVGRKTANLIVGEIYGKPAVIADTHFVRVTKRLGFHNTKNPEKTERIMRELLPAEKSTKFCHAVVMHGRTICKAARPKCACCCLRTMCNYFN
jgi:endonuclease-3